MVTYPKSVSLICTAASLVAANEALDLAPVSPADPEPGNRGTGNISVPLSASGELPATHYGAHAWDNEIAALLQDPETAATMPMILARVIDNPDGRTVGFHDFIAMHGLVRIVLEEI